MGTSWSLHIIFIKKLSDVLSPIFLMFPTFLGMSISLILLQNRVSIITTCNILLNKKYLNFYLISAFLGYVLPVYLEFYIAEHVYSWLLTLIGTTNPIVTIFLSKIFNIEKINYRKSLVSIIGFLGALIMFIPSTQILPNAQAIKWALLSFSIPFTYATYNLYIVKKWPLDINSPSVVATIETVFATVLTLPLFLMFISYDHLLILIDKIQHIAYLIIFTTIEVLSFFYLIKRAGAVFVSFSTFITLIAGFAFSNIIFSETINFWGLVSGVLVLTALYLILNEKSILEK